MAGERKDVVIAPLHANALRHAHSAALTGLVSCTRSRMAEVVYARLRFSRASGAMSLRDSRDQQGVAVRFIAQLRAAPHCADTCARL